MNKHEVGHAQMLSNYPLIEIKTYVMSFSIDVIRTTLLTIKVLFPHFYDKRIVKKVFYCL